jgi:hypothetical protein
MFRANTDSKCIFKKFKELTSDDELRVSDTLEQHATGVMNVIDDTIMNIENVDYVFELLNATGRKHSTYEGSYGGGKFDFWSPPSSYNELDITRHCKW